MSPILQSYLADLDRSMSRLDPDQRRDALREIEAHFADATVAGASPEELITRLGPPKLLAAALVAETLDRHDESSRASTRRMIAGWLFVTGSSFTSLMVVPLLAVIAAGFGLVAVFSPIAGVLRTFGATWIHVDFGPGRELPTEWSIPFMLGLGIVCAAIAIGAYQALRIYIRAVGRGYRAVFARGVVTVASAT
jgi:uncharacterized membrane protein